MTKVVVGECKHPEGKSFKEPREDGSGKWDLICGVCGFTMCEIMNPMESAAPVVAEAKAAAVGPCVNTDCPDNSKQGCGKNVLECDNYIEISAHVCMTESCANYGQELDGSNCMKFGGADILDCVDFTSTREAVASEVEKAEGDGVSAPEPSTTVEEGAGEVTSPFTSDDNQPKSYVSREPDKIGGRFQELLPVPVDDHELAEYGKELAEQTSLWRRTKLDAKKFAKAAKEITDKCEDKMIELEEIIQDHARLTSVDVQWEYDFTGGVKKLRRCDTWEIVKEETLTAEERQPAFDFGASQAAVNKLAEVQAGGEPPLQGEGGEEVQTPLTDDPSEVCRVCEGAGYYIEDDPDKKGGEVFCTCEAGKLLEKQSFPETQAVEEEFFPFSAEPVDLKEHMAEVASDETPVIDIDAQAVDTERRCCFPSDRAELVEGDVVVSYCRVCRLILKKTPVGGDPWDSIDFVYGEKVNLEEPGAQA